MPRMSRRTLPALVAAAGCAVQAQAQDAAGFPSQTVRLIVPFPPGGPADLVARALARDLAADWRQPVVVENRAGGNGFPAAEAVARALPDGHTLFVPFFGTLVVVPHLYPSLPFDPIRDFAPVAALATLPLMLVVKPDAPFRSVSDIVEAARRQPGTISYASGGVGQGAHLAGALLQQMTGAPLVHVPYRGNAPAVADVIAGHVTMIFDGMATSLPHVRDGRLRGIAVSTAQRASSMPELPTVAESGWPGFDVGSWFGLLAPAATPPAIVSAINARVLEVMARPAFRRMLADSGLEPLPGSPAAFATLIREETLRWGALIRAAGIRME